MIPEIKPIEPLPPTLDDVAEHLRNGGHLFVIRSVAIKAGEFITRVDVLTELFDMKNTDPKGSDRDCARFHTDFKQKFPADFDATGYGFLKLKRYAEESHCRAFLGIPVGEAHYVTNRKWHTGTDPAERFSKHPL